MIKSDSVVYNARFERERKGEKDVNWSWKHSTFSGTRELNGLRTLMAMLNNWDLKDENNSVYKDHDEEIYEISDLGASFGTTHIVLGHGNSRGNVRAYERSRFITHTSAERVDFACPGTPTWFFIVNPRQFFMRTRLESLGRHVPRADAKWMGTILARLSPAQIRDAFRAAGYQSEDVERFARVVETRIAALNAL